MPEITTTSEEAATNNEAVRAAAATLSRFKMSFHDFSLVHKPGYRFKIPLPPEAIPILRQEEYFTPDNEPERGTWTEEMARAFGLGLETCPKCFGDGWFHEPHTGVNTGIKVDLKLQCQCSLYRRFFLSGRT